jgi:hypothetical protein
MKLGHHINGCRWHLLSNPLQHRLCATVDVIRHHEVPDGEVLAPLMQ